MDYYKNFLSHDECEFLINYIEDKNHIENKNDTRDFYFYHFTNYENFSFLLDKLKYLDVKEKPVFNINKYLVGSYFKPHIDTGGEYDKNNERMKSLVINLSDVNSYSGGNLIINGDSVELSKGDGVLFNCDVIHEVTELLHGVRYSLIFWFKKENLDLNHLI